jgi:hypothetical protein
MPKFSSLEEIEKAYRQKQWRLKQRYTRTIRDRDLWINIKKKSIWNDKEDTRQRCMTLAQSNCKLLEVINTWNPVIQCCSCNNSYHYKDMDGGHKEGRANKRVCIHTMNINPQCSRCNNPARKPKDEQERIKEYLIDRYWESEYNRFDKLCKMWWSYQVTKDHREREEIRLFAINKELKEKVREMWF